MMLAADEGKSFPHLEKEVLDPNDKGPLQVSFLSVVGERQKVELVGVLQDLLREVRRWRRQRAIKIRDSMSLTVVQAGLDLRREHGTAPTMLKRCFSIPEPVGWVL